MTNDAGKTWNVRKFPDMHDIHGIAFKDSLNGWIIDSFHCYQTNNGGKNWKKVSMNLSTYIFHDIFCFNDTVYLLLKPFTSVLLELVGANSLIIKSTDSGKTWQKLDVHIGGKLLSAFFLNEKCGFLYSEENVSIDARYTFFYKTYDGGEKWIKSIFPISYHTLGMHFINPDTGFVGQYRTTDGGMTWENMFLDHFPGNENFEAIFFTDSNHGWALNWYKIFQTVNGGLSWQLLDQQGSYRLMDINSTENGTGWIVGWGCNIFKKSPGENEWIPFSTGPRNVLNDIFFINQNEGWCVGTGGLILHTVNGGELWEQQESHIDSTLFTVKFINNLEGWIVGDRLVLNTNNGGHTWNIQNDLNLQFTDIDFFNEKTGLLIDGFGKIFRTTNSGKDWRIVSDENFSLLLTSVEIINENEAWIGGSGGLVHTTDGGETFQWHSFPYLNTVRDVQFINDNHGWLRNYNGVLFETTDAGTTWYEFPMGKGIEDGPIAAFYMANAKNGWIYSLSEGGYLVQVILDGSLSVINKYAVHLINSIYFFNSSSGWAAGGGGTILKYKGTDELLPVEKDQRINIFPNPSTKEGLYITFYLYQVQFVTVRVFNSVGQEIQTLYSDWFSDGEIMLVWTLHNIASGTYFISVECNEFSQTQKCTIIH
ncbi:MAG: hypothetical protein A2W23_01880 [Planctomycetes bacterium RBG_16_43_13]|nr:MAG: hypothetical protein A2W23_01880 [Planctomycetes bacterium RBG_16_43_13]